MTLSHHCTVAWVTRPERPKGVKDVIKQARRAAAQKSGPGGYILYFLGTTCTRVQLPKATKTLVRKNRYNQTQCSYFHMKAFQSQIHVSIAKIKTAWAMTKTKTCVFCQDNEQGTKSQIQIQPSQILHHVKLFVANQHFLSILVADQQFSWQLSALGISFLFQHFGIS